MYLPCSTPGTSLLSLGNGHGIQLNNPFNTYVKHHYTISDLLNILSNIAKEKLNDNKKHLDYYVNKWKQILEDCKGWIVDEEIVEQQ